MAIWRLVAASLPLAAQALKLPAGVGCTRRVAIGTCAAFSSALALATPSAALAAAPVSDGKWAQRFEPFTDEDFAGMTTTPSGLQYKVVAEGYGVKPLAGQKIKAHYAGYLLNGAKFDASYDRRSPLEFNVGVGRV